MHCIFQIVRHNLGIMVPLDARLPAGSPYNLQITTPKPQTKPPNPAYRHYLTPFRAPFFLGRAAIVNSFP